MSDRETPRTDTRLDTILAGRYRITQRVGSGGMGVVYRGERVELGRPVAIKFLQDLFVGNEKFNARFDREARAMSKLSHPYCVSVIDFGVEGAPYIVMDWVTGITLKERLTTERLTISHAMEIAGQLLAGLAHAHGQGIVHRDIKPDNIMLCESTGMGEHVRIFDFGLAKLLDTGKEQFSSMASQLIGTPSYMSPEQTHGTAVDGRTDLYSAAVVLFEMLTGRKPFVEEQPMEALRMHREVPPPSLGEVDEDLSYSAELEAVVHQALAKSPDDRFQTAELFARALEATPEGGRAVTDEQQSLGTTQKQVAVRVEQSSSEQETVALTSESLGESTYEQRSAARKWRFLGFAVLFLFVAIIGVVVAVFSGKSRTSHPVSGEGKVEESGLAQKTNGAEAEKDRAVASSSDSGANKVAVMRSIADVETLIQSGDRDGAIKGLQLLRASEPENPRLPYLLGNLFFEKRWWADGMERYKDAIRLDSEYRKDPILNRNLIAVLSSEKLFRKARALILKSIGSDALPYLQQAAREGDSPMIRRRARGLMGQLSEQTE